jgi:hypothetical protein
MSHSTHNDAPVFLLPETSFQSLHELRNLMFLIASIIFVATKEESIALQIPRSLLAQCFQLFARQLADNLDAAQRVVVTDHNVQRTH